MSVNHNARSGTFSIFFNMKICCVFSLESPHRDRMSDSYEYTQHTSFNTYKKKSLNYCRSTAIGFFLGTQRRGRNSRCKRAICVRLVIEVCKGSSLFSIKSNFDRRHAWLLIQSK